MSKAPKKKEDTNISGIFSIPANPFEDGDIPGVTQLLSRPKAEELKKSVKSLEPTRVGGLKTLPARQAEQTNVTRTNMVMASPQQLKELGVLFELRFNQEGSHFRFTSAQGHKEAGLLPWQQEIYEKMIMDKRSVPAKEPFQEFRADSEPFLFDAFAVQSHHTIQVVTPEYTNTRIVLVSDKSVAEHAAAIVEHFSKG